MAYVYKPTERDGGRRVAFFERARVPYRTTDGRRSYIPTQRTAAAVVCKSERFKGNISRRLLYVPFTFHFTRRYIRVLYRPVFRNDASCSRSRNAAVIYVDDEGKNENYKKIVRNVRRSREKTVVPKSDEIASWQRRRRKRDATYENKSEPRFPRLCDNIYNLYGRVRRKSTRSFFLFHARVVRFLLFTRPTRPLRNVVRAAHTHTHARTHAPVVQLTTRRLFTRVKMTRIYNGRAGDNRGGREHLCCKASRPRFSPGDRFGESGPLIRGQYCATIIFSE